MKLRILVAVDNAGEWVAIGGEGVAGPEMFELWNLTDNLGKCKYHELELEVTLAGPAVDIEHHDVTATSKHIGDEA